MEPVAETGAAPAAGATANSLSPGARIAAIFTRPAAAWSGLETRTQWWIPLLLFVVISASGTALLHKRALVPMMVEAWDRQVTAGAMTQAQMDKMEDFFSGPVGLTISVVQQVILIPIFSMVVALLVWFGAGFVLGTKMRYRHALEVATWSSLVSLPNYVLTFVLVWFKETFRGVHTGFGVLLPEMETPSKLMTGLGVLLDALGPFSIWYLAVGILGTAALSGAPRKSVTWVMVGLYLAVIVFVAAIAAMFTPTA
jgi:Yip1 domain